MAILEESTESVSSDQQSLLQTLRIPAEYARFEALGDNEIYDRLDQWKTNALLALSTLREQLKLKNALGTEQQADITFNAASYTGEVGEWSTEQMHDISIDILEFLGEPDIHVLERTLNHHIKSLFRANPHPSLNASTGRKISRQAGGPMAAQDVYEDQLWKRSPGVGNALLWCVQRIHTEMYERLWGLVVPPIMILLDDYDVKYKIEGIHMVEALLKNAPPDLLKRTGISDLLFSSLHRALTFLHSPYTPTLLRSAIPVVVNLVQRTNSGPAERFSRLCSLLGDGIIGSVWMYGYHDPDAIEASVEVLPIIIQALEVGSVRYLKALIPQLTHPLYPNPGKPPELSLQMTSLRALIFVIQTCAPRMHRWKGTILEASAKCWVTNADSGLHGKDVADLNKTLRKVCAELVRVCPSVVKDYQTLMTIDPQMFEGLVADL